MAQTHGDVYSIKEGRRLTIAINSFAAAEEAFSKKGKDFAGRPASQAQSILTDGGKSMISCDFGPRWRLRREVTQTALSDFSAPAILEEAFREEADHLMHQFQNAMREPFDPKYKVYLAVVNAMCAIVFGNKYEINNPEFYEIVELNNRLDRIGANGEILDRFPWLKYFPTDLMNDIHEAKAFRDRFCKRKLQEHRQSFRGDKIRDLTDALLKTVSDADSKNTQVEPEEAVTDRDLIFTMMDFLSAGTDKMSAGICWVLAYLTIHPEAQVKVHQEMDNVIGRGRLPGLSDKANLPYLTAVINETLRLSPPLPTGIPHRAVIGTTLQGYDIPRNSLVFVNLWAIHRDPRHWDDPTFFRPERFLHKDGRLQVGYLPFGAGPRSCLGENLANAGLFLFISRLLHQFKFSVPPGHNPPDMTGSLTTVLAHAPKPFNFVATKR